MSIGKRIAHRAEAVKGSAMRTVGRLTGNPAAAGQRPP